MDKSDRFFFLCGLMMAAGELWKQWCITFLLSGGIYVWWYFPFQLCSIPMYLLLLIPAVKNTRLKTIFYTFIMDFSLLGGIAVFFDSSGLHYELPALTIFSYSWHIILIMLGIAAGIFKKGNETLRGFLRTLPLYAAGCVLATIFNILFISYGDLNLFYISPYFHMTQRFFKDIAFSLGDTPAAAVYIAATIFGAFLLHLLWRILFRYTSTHKKGVQSF